MNVCEQCVSQVRKRLKTFDQENNITTSAPYLRDHLRNEIEILYPGLFDLIQDPKRWIGPFETVWFPLSPEKVANETLHIELVIAPLPFIATVVRIQCKCGHSHRVINLGVNFYVMASHLSAYFIERGLSSNQLALLIGELMSKTPNWRSYPIPQSIPRDILSSGMAWLLCHEIGHFASPTFQFRPKVPLEVPAYAMNHLLEELSADYNSFMMLIHRTQAKFQKDPLLISKLLGGVALILKAWNVMIPDCRRRQINITNYGDHIGATTPSPSLRWRALQSAFNTCAELGFTSWEHYNKIEKTLYRNYETKLDILWDKLNKYEIFF